MASLHNDVLDSGLSVLDTLVENLYICSSLPTTFTEANTTYKLGTKATPTVAAPSDRGAGGREVVISAITDGVVNTEGSAGFYALTDDSASKLLAAGALSSAQTVYTANPFTTAEFAIGIPDPA